MDNVLKYKELTGKILKASFVVHDSLGCGFLEKVYPVRENITKEK